MATKTSTVLMLSAAVLAKPYSEASASPTVGKGRVLIEICKRHKPCAKAAQRAGRWLRRKYDTAAGTASDGIDAVGAGVGEAGKRWSENRLRRAKLDRIDKLHGLFLPKAK